MAKWEEWLNNDTSKKDKTNSKFHEEFDERAQREKKGRQKARPSRAATHEEYPSD